MFAHFQESMWISSSHTLILVAVENGNLWLKLTAEAYKLALRPEDANLLREVFLNDSMIQTIRWSSFLRS